MSIAAKHVTSNYVCVYTYIYIYIYLYKKGKVFPVTGQVWNRGWVEV
jgi:hypothetical protein